MVTVSEIRSFCGLIGFEKSVFDFGALSKDT